MTKAAILPVAVAALLLATPGVALADSHWGHGHGHGRGEGWRGNDWRDGGYWHGGGWRGRGWYGRSAWAYRGYGWRWGYPRRCWIEDRGFYDWYGYYVYRPVRICR